MRIGFRVDSSLVIGGGHVSRCMSLAAELEARGSDIVFFCRTLNGDYNDKINTKYQCVTFDSHNPSEIDIEVEMAIISNYVLEVGALDWLIIDNYAITQEWEISAGRIAEKTLVIDDFVNRSHACDIYLNQSTARVTDDQEDLINSASFLLGTSYALLDRNILNYRISKSDGPKRIYNIVIDFGSSNNFEIFVKAIETVKLLERDNLQIKAEVMLGRNEQLLMFLEHKFYGVGGLNFHLFANNYLQILAECDLAIGSCGVTSLERCCLGIPSFVIPIVDNQLLLLELLMQNGCVKLVGGLNDIDVPLLRKGLIDYVNNGIDLTWSESCKKVVDGKGVKRLADILAVNRSIPVKLRGAKKTDAFVLFEWKNERAARKYSILQGKLEFSSHESWFLDKLKHESCRLFILETQNEIPLGQIRFENKGIGWELSYSIDSKYRNNGFGKKIIQMGLEFLSLPVPYIVYARVTKDNKISNKIFNALGFKCDTHSSDIFVYKKEYSL
jgi:UDP-2,4-diacetamido-2,4,6-trideoxy-beta-L-altropyranose hydrolase